MKTFTFRYDPHPRHTALAGITKALKSGKGEIHRDEIYCKSMDEMMRLLTKSRFQVFTAIVEVAPGSVTELADELDKDLGNVLRDVKFLETLGLVELKRSKGKRGEKFKPIALYDRILFECEPKRERKVI